MKNGLNSSVYDMEANIWEFIQANYSYINQQSCSYQREGATPVSILIVGSVCVFSLSFGRLMKSEIL